MIPLLRLHLIVGIIIIIKENNAEKLTAAQICNNPKTTSATQTPFGVICIIPQPTDPVMEKRQHFARSHPKIVKPEQNENIGNKIAPNFKLRNPFSPQTNILSKRSIFSNWFHKFYANFYTKFSQTLYGKQEEKSQSQPENLPQASAPQPSSVPRHPIAHPLAQHQHAGHPHPQESRFNRYPIPYIQRPDPFLAAALAQHVIPHPNDLHSAANQDYISLHPYNAEQLGMNYHIDETRLGNAIVDLSQYHEPEAHYSSYLQALKHNQRKLQNLSKSNQNIRVEYIYDNNNNDNNNENEKQNDEKQEIIIPLYTEVKVKKTDLSQTRSSSQLRSAANSPRQQISEQYGLQQQPYKTSRKIKKTNCKDVEFKPIVSESETPKPPIRKKRYIELDYSKMQMRKVPIWFQRNDGNPSPEAIVEVKPRSLFRWQQPMRGWRPIVPPEVGRKDVFLKRSGDQMENWDHEQVESQSHFQWDRVQPKFHRPEPKASESQNVQSAKILDLSKGEVNTQRRSHRNKKNKNLKQQQNHGLTAGKDNKYEAENIVYQQKPEVQTDKQHKNQVIGSEIQKPQENQYLPEGMPILEGIQAVEVENLGDFSKAKSLQDIASIPGAVIRPIDPKLTDILLKVLSYNTDFAQKRITNAYFLEFPKIQEYKPKAAKVEKSVKSSSNFIGQDSHKVESPEKAPEMSVESVKDKIELDYEKDIDMDESDYEYGEALCDGRVSGALADVRKNCRVYYQCTEFTIDTYVCPKGTRFDNHKLYCLPSNDVICGKSS